MAAPIKYAIARDGAEWIGTASRMTVDAEGALCLARLPGRADGVAIVRDISPPLPLGGLAFAADGAWAVADEARGLIEMVWPGCPEPLTLGYGGHGPVMTPGPLAWQEERLVVIDRSDGSLNWLDRTDGGLVRRLRAPFAGPVALATDGEGRLIVLDAAAPFLHRLDDQGRLDQDFRAKVDGAPGDAPLAKPFAVAVGAGGWIVVADGQNGLLLFDADGAAMGTIPPPTAGFEPGAVAADQHRLYAHDRATGRIHGYAPDAGEWLDGLPHWTGALAAMAVAPGGDLWIKSDPGLAVMMLEADAATMSSGDWRLGPLDAGEEQGWHRLALDWEAPPGTRARLRYCLRSSATPLPDETDFQPLASPTSGLPTDILIGRRAPDPDLTLGTPPLPEPPPPPLRYLWLIVTFESDDARASPRLVQATAATRGEAFIDHLPGFYAESSPAGGLLDRLCDLIGFSVTAAAGEARGWSAAIAPGTAPEAMLAPLLQWLDTDAAEWLPAATKRMLLGEAVKRHVGRGTAAGLAADIADQAGVAVAVRESFADRRIWRLDTGWGLGFDTALPAVDEGVLLGGAIEDGGPCPPLFPGSLANATAEGPSPGYGASLFADAAYRFMLVAPPGSDRAGLTAAAALAERDRPAHTVFGLCTAPDGMRLGHGPGLGQGLRLGDGVAGTGLEEWRLGASSRLADPPARSTPALLTLDGSAMSGGTSHGG